MVRIAALVTYDSTSKFLGAPKLIEFKPENIAGAVYEQIVKWNITDQVVAMGYDTTSSNTGMHAGSCVLLQNKLDRELLELACRHHMYELPLRAVFKSNAPKVQIFERFRKTWNDLDHNRYQSGMVDDIIVSALPLDEINDFKSYCTHQLTKLHARGDYRELLLLGLVFLGEKVANFQLPVPPAMHGGWQKPYI